MLTADPCDTRRVPPYVRRIYEAACRVAAAHDNQVTPKRLLAELNRDSARPIALVTAKNYCQRLRRSGLWRAEWKRGRYSAAALRESGIKMISLAEELDRERAVAARAERQVQEALMGLDPEARRRVLARVAQA